MGNILNVIMVSTCGDAGSIQHKVEGTMDFNLIKWVKSSLYIKINTGLT